MRYEYKYTDLDGDRLIIEAPGWPANTASISTNGNAVFVKADEAPKAAQAILDAAGVKGVVLTDLPEVEVKALLGAKADTDAFAGLRKAVAEAGVKAAAVKKAHDDLRTSPIALKALALYNRGLIGVGPYASWDAINEGYGASDELVHYYIRRAEKEEAKEKEAAEKLAARRLDIYKELGGVFFSKFEPLSPIGYAIDRIIALEDAK